MQYDESIARTKDAGTVTTTNIPSSTIPTTVGAAEGETLVKPTQIKIETTTRIIPLDEAAVVAAPAAVVAAPAASSAGAAAVLPEAEGIHERTMTDKVKEILMDTAHVAKEKTLDVLHVAYEKLHDASIVVEDKAAQALKKMSHAQQNKADELEQLAAQKRIEVAADETKSKVAETWPTASSETIVVTEEHAKSPGILTKAYNKVHDGVIAVEEKAAQFFKNMGHSNQQTAAELEKDATERRLDTFGEEVVPQPQEKGVIQKVTEKVKDLTIKAEEKVAGTLKGMGHSNQETAANLQQDAGERRVDTAVENVGDNRGILDKAMDKIQSATATIEDSAAKALREISDKGKSKATELEFDATQRKRTPSPGRISPAVLDSFGAVSANVEEKAARMRQSMGTSGASSWSQPLGSGFGREIDVDSVLGTQSSFLAPHPTGKDYSEATRLPKEVPPPEERKVVPDPVD